MKKTYLIDAWITCVPPSYIDDYSRHNQLELQEKAIEEWIDEILKLLCEHWQQDLVYPEIRRIYQDRCEFCNEEWDEDEEGCPLCCDRAAEEWEESNK